jgi:hypothetical protein
MKQQLLHTPLQNKKLFKFRSENKKYSDLENLPFNLSPIQLSESPLVTPFDKSQ